MNYKFNPYILVTFLFSILFFTVFSSVGVFKENTTNFLASVFFSKSIYTEDIIDKYDDALSKKKKEKVKILIVPGHDNKSFGAYANNTTEAEINLAVAKELKKHLRKRKRY